MTVREILQIGHPALRRPARKVAPGELSSGAVQELIDDLIETMRHARGAGLAATQVGEDLRITVMEVEANERYPYKPPLPLTVAVNPVVTFNPAGPTFMVNEGCLSVPLRGDVRRHMDITVTYLDRHGEPLTSRVTGLTAGTWQHEVDHLDGILFTDRVEDPTTLATWDEFSRHHRQEFIDRLRAGGLAPAPE